MNYETQKIYSNIIYVKELQKYEAEIIFLYH